MAGRVPRGGVRARYREPVHRPPQAEDRGRTGTRTMSPRLRHALSPALALVLLGAAPIVLAAMQADPFTASQNDPVLPLHTLDEIRHAFLRLPLAAALGAMLAFRPKRRGTPPPPT